MASTECKLSDYFQNAIALMKILKGFTPKTYAKSIFSSAICEIYAKRGKQKA
ncbi:MAG: hypothetical protein V7K71_23955 [Nostoc sp.]|uniref:hypothetical protein n=1 Tax=Nostoc sp. TaxID=1180 RepID=UPI002FF8B82A